ncbi:MAG: GNAT family N-acetyltransferase [Actinomycetota bacterium]
MRGVEIQAFSDEHVDAAAGLLKARHAAHLDAEPLLPANVDYRAEVEALWKGEAVSGVVATRGGEVVGYLLGVRRDDAIWGPNIWVELAGHAAIEPEIVRDLYGAASADWVEAGRHRHYALVPATDKPLVDAWFRLSFGAQQAMAIQETPEAPDSLPSEIDVRRAGPADLEAAMTLGGVLPEHQEQSPVFAGYLTQTDEEERAEVAEELADPEVATFIAEREGRPLGLLIIAPADKSPTHAGLARPERAALLGFAATIPEARGSGAGLALTAAGLVWARENGHPIVVVDWRETNLLASRFWPARGFRRTFLRLYRSIP